MAGRCLEEETLERFAQLPVANGWMNDLLYRLVAPATSR